MAGIPTAPTAGTPTAYTPTTDALSAFKSRIEEFHDASARDIDSIDAYFGGEGSYCSREVSDLWAHTVESLQSYLYSSLVRGEKVPSDLWQVYEDFYLANKDYHPVDPCIKGTHESLGRFYYRPLLEEAECPSGYQTPPRMRPASPCPEGPIAIRRRDLLLTKAAAKLACAASPPEDLSFAPERWETLLSAACESMVAAGNGAAVSKDSIEAWMDKLVATIRAIAEPEDMPPLERADSPLTDEDIDEALHAAEAAWDY
jgi:hypothetical protein